MSKFTTSKHSVANQ